MKFHFWTPGIDPRVTTRVLPDGSYEKHTTWRRGPTLCEVDIVRVLKHLGRTLATAIGMR